MPMMIATMPRNRTGVTVPMIIVGAISIVAAGDVGVISGVTGDIVLSCSF